MFRKVLFLTAVVVFFSFCCQVQAAHYNAEWNGGTSGLWGNPGNWINSGGMVPHNEGGNTFVVIIDGGATDAQVGLMQGRTVDELNCYGTVELQKWTSDWIMLTLDHNGLINYGDLAIDEIDIKGDVINKSGGSLEFWEHINIIDGNLINETNARMQFDDEDIDIEGGFIENNGLILCFLGGGPGETQLFENRGSINLFGGACSSEDVFDNNSTGNIEGYGAIVGHQILLNKGVIRASLGTLLLLSEGSIVNADTGLLMNKPLSSLHITTVADVNNFGTIEVNASGGVAFDCNLINEPEGTIKLLGGTLAAKTITQKAGATFEGFGSITGDVIIEPNSVSEPNSIIRLTGPTNIIGDVNIPAGATLEISDGQTLITGHTTNNGTIHLIGGTVIFQGGYSGSGNIINEAGTDRNHFDLNADGIEDFKDFAYFAETWLWRASWY